MRSIEKLLCGACAVLLGGCAVLEGDAPPRATIGAVLGTPGTAERPGMDIEIEMVAYVPEERA